ncbi:Ubiquitin Carboxyl-Terminal Hydrolase 19 [Manis pentadactyla]|nr:Ubiquitin Carboxyl-Terminal Hydrolase 19 [Manis pentadactyla]
MMDSMDSCPDRGATAGVPDLLRWFLHGCIWGNLSRVQSGILINGGAWSCAQSPGAEGHKEAKQNRYLMYYCGSKLNKAKMSLFPIKARPQLQCD